MKHPAAGERDKRIEIRVRNDTPENDADLVSGYKRVGGRWALLEPLGTLLVHSGIQVNKKITHRLTFKRLPGIDDSHEVVMGKRLFRVVGVGDVNESGIDTVLEVEEITGNPASAPSMPKRDIYDE
ncbi:MULTISPECIES: head-tail adaptor protein [unclassified Pseudomonas]|uniref:head-tail adaptor protein n=1 Tax=unclassified Pseudomonas TaxID=196821 RepID=UPI001F55D1D5|nr:MULTISPECIES: head-tail adaptor protein [unclassified Pseudomonas]